MKTYTELIRFSTFAHRLAYLSLPGKPSEETFAELRFLNQRFYMSADWKNLRDEIITRDGGYDLGIPGRYISGKVIVHHIEPIMPNDIFHCTDRLLNPDNLITVSDQTHRAIHYGFIPEPIFTERRQGDTHSWQSLTRQKNT